MPPFRYMGPTPERIKKIRERRAEQVWLTFRPGAATFGTAPESPDLQNDELRQPGDAGVPGPVAEGDLGIAEGANSEEWSPAENALLATIEARLADEVRGLILALFKFASGAKAVREELPERAQFCKLVTMALELLALQGAHALGKDADMPLFLDDGREYLTRVGLHLKDFVREIDLNGRRFLAIALVDEKSSQILGSVPQSEHR